MLSLTVAHRSSAQRLLRVGLREQTFFQRTLISGAVKSHATSRLAVVPVRHKSSLTQLLRRRLLSTASTQTTKSGGSRWLPRIINNNPEKNSSSSKWTRWHRVAKVIKILRIPALMVSVYGIGYQQGIIECSKYPLMMQDQLLKSVLADCGVRHRDQVTIFTSDDSNILPINPTTVLQSKVVRIGNSIVQAASTFAREELQKAVEKAQRELPPDATLPMQEHLLMENKDVVFWRDALIRIEGETKHLPWQYLIVQTDLPNAFVTEILPQRFFITTSMFENIVENEDELATILGHEISHLILGHVSQRNYMETMLRTIEVLLLALDPTEGVLSLGVIAGLASLRALLIASFSREHENEADELGLRLAAMACYNTERGAYVMKKMHDYQVALAGSPQSNTHLLSLLDTHPPSLDRYERILEMSKTENSDKYSHSTCASVHRRMLQAIWGRASPP